MAIRDCERVEISADDVAPDDLVALIDGDRICTDMTCFESHGLLADSCSADARTGGRRTRRAVLSIAA